MVILNVTSLDEYDMQNIGGWLKALFLNYAQQKIYRIYIHNLGYFEVLSENAIKMSVNIIVCLPDLVIITYFGNNTIEIKRIVFT